jgi:hypothetical protein
VSEHFDHLDDNEREWLRASRRNAARRSWLLIVVLVAAALLLAWLTVDGLPWGGGGAATTTTTPDQRVVADGEEALADWGVFAVSNDLADVKDSFWANGPQYKLLAEESKDRKALGPPPYKMTMTDVKVIKPGGREDQRVLRGKVQLTRAGEKPQSYDWDVLLQVDPAAGGRWRLWTVTPTAGT